MNAWYSNLFSLYVTWTINEKIIFVLYRLSGPAKWGLMLTQCIRKLILEIRIVVVSFKWFGEQSKHKYINICWVRPYAYLFCILLEYLMLLNSLNGSLISRHNYIHVHPTKQISIKTEWKYTKTTKFRKKMTEPVKTLTWKWIKRIFFPTFYTIVMYSVYRCSHPL